MARHETWPQGQGPWPTSLGRVACQELEMAHAKSWR